MHLTDKERAMLDGSDGPAAAKALALLVDIGDFFGAARLIPVHSAHVSGVSYLTGGDGLIEHTAFFADLGAKVAVPTTLNPCGMDRERYKAMAIDEAFAAKQCVILENFGRMGVLTTCSCTPYDFGHIPRKGETVAWAESSAVCFANSYFGAHTNKEDALSALAAALTGRTPEYGFHLDENRVPNVRVEVAATLRDGGDYSLLGDHVGHALKGTSFAYGAIPLFVGPRGCRPHQIKALGAALASHGVHLFHIEGVTPERELYAEARPEHALQVTDADLAALAAKLAPEDEVGLYVLGCPNASFEELAEVADRVQGRKLKPGKELWVFASRPQKALAEAVGFLDTFTKAGIEVFCDTCPEVTPYHRERYPAVLTNSAKAVHYIQAPGLANTPAFFLPLDRAVEAFFEEAQA